MHHRKSKKILFYLFLLIMFGSINNISLGKLKFDPLSTINVSGLSDTENQNLLGDIKNLNLENLFFLNAREITKIIESNALVENYSVFKKYPSTLDIKIKKTTLLAQINIDGQIFFIGTNGKFMKKLFPNEKLPYIFGKPEIQEFLNFKKIIDNSKILFHEIKSFYYFQSKRWDIKLKNDILIKLSRDDTEESLENALKILNEKSIKSIKVVDARIKNQIILDE